MDTKLTELVGKLKEEAQKHDALQKEFQKSQQARQMFLQQQQENDMVLEELNLLDEDANVYKLIGPALVKQEQVEAKENVKKRLAFIKQELKKLESNAKASEEKRAQQYNTVMQLQEQVQRCQVSAP